jgi:hypothetical protein
LRDIYETAFVYFIFTTQVPGLFFNTLTAIVFYFGHQFWKDDNRIGYYMIIQALTGNCLLVLKIVQYSTINMLLNFNVINCQVRTSFSIFLNLFSGLFQFMMTIERYINIKYTKERNTMFNKKFYIYIYTFVLFIISLGASALSFTRYIRFNYYYVDEKSLKLINIPSCVYNQLTGLIMTFLYLFFRIIPTILMMVLNILISIVLIQSKLKFNLTRSLKREYIFGATLVLMNFIFIIASIPYFTVFALCIFDKSYQSSMIEQFCIWLLYLYEACHFFYNISFNKAFRSEIKIFFNFFIFRRR